MEFIILNIKLMVTFFITFILFIILFEGLNRSKLHTFVSMQKVIRKSGKRKFIRNVITLISMIVYLIFIGRVDIGIYQMGTLLGMGYALIHIITKPGKKAKNTQRMEQV